VRRLARYVSLAVLVLLCLVAGALLATQTGWFKNYLRGVVVNQAAQYLNGTLTVERLRGTVLTGIVLEGVALHHEGQTAVAIDTLTVNYDPVTMVRQGLILKTLTLDRPTILLQRDDAGWNFNRFVKTRKNTGGKGAPPLTIQTLNFNDGRLIVRDRGKLIEDLTSLNSTLRLVYHKPGVEFDIARLSGRSPNVNINRLSGNLRFEGGATEVGNLSVETDRSSLVATVGWTAAPDRRLDVTLRADRLSLPEVGLFFGPVAGIKLAPRIEVNAHGPFDALVMDVSVVSSAGNARGPLVGHFGTHPGLEGTLDVQNVDLQDLVNRREWKTLVTGQAKFDWKFGRPTAVGSGAPMKITFTFSGPDVQGFGYRAANVRAQGVYETPDLKFDASGAGYGATATTRATFHFPASGPMTYTLAGDFLELDMRRLPPSLAMPKLDTVTAGQYQFESTGRDWSGRGTLSDSVVEGARIGPGTILEIDSHNSALHYAATGTVAGLDPHRFALPFDLSWLADDRFRGRLTGAFTFNGSGRTVDQLVMNTTADLTDSILAGAHFPQAHAAMNMSGRRLSSDFAGTFERLSGSLFTASAELADATLNGSADMGVTMAIPAVGPVQLDGLHGTATLASSTIAGLAVDSGQVAGTFANGLADIRAVSFKGPGIDASAKGALALGTTGQSNMQYDIAVSDLGPIGKRVSLPLTGGARAVGQATGPSSQLAITGTVDANRFAYSTTVDALTATSKYSITLPDWDIERARIEADTNGTFVTIAGLNLPRASARMTYQSKELAFDASFEQDKRSLGVAGRLVLHPDHNEVHLRALSLMVGPTTWALPAGEEATAQYTSTSITVENFVLQRGDQKLTAAGTVAIGVASDSVANDLNVRLDAVQVRDINEMLLGERSLEGVLNATAEIRGTRADPLVQSTFALTAGNVQGVGFESLNGKAGYEGRVVTLDARLQQSPAAFLTAVGTVPVPTGPGEHSRAETFDLTVKSSPIDVALFQAATTQLTKLSGQLLANLHVGGTMEAPQVEGQLDVTNAGFTVQATSVTYRNLLAKLTFDGARVLVDRFEILDNDNSRLVALGEIGIAQRSVGVMNVQVSATNFKVLDNEFGRVVVDSDLRISGDATKPQISGTLSTPTGRVEVDQLLEQLTKNPYSTQATVETTLDNPPPAIAGTPPVSSPLTGTALYRAATIDVRVTLPDDLLLRGRSLQTAYSRIGLGSMNITVGGGLDIRKASGGEPEVVGTVSVVRGFYEFQGRRFDVLRDSQIRFQGLMPIDPALQVDAQRLISGVTAVVNIRGTARQPIVSLSSTPPMDEADVLSLIVFNQPINQLGESERVNLAQRAGGLAAGYITTPLANSIANALGIDLFEIRPEGGMNGQPSVALGQQFGSRLFVQFRQDFGSEDRSELSLEYRINEFLRLVSTVAQGAQQSHRTQRVDTTGADFIYVLSY
jgi:autotransporter translocation and assembly factor TamB